MVEVRLKYDYKLEDIDVCDMKNVKFTLVGKLTPMLMKTILEIIQVRNFIINNNYIKCYFM